MGTGTAPRAPLATALLRSRAAVFGAAAAALVAAVLVAVVLVQRHTTSAPSGSGAGARRDSGWLSGASSDEAANGGYGSWRGTPIEIGGTWDNGNDEQVRMRTICAGGPWAGWDKALDVAVGAIDVDAGESWRAAADGAYVDRWRANLLQIKKCWGARDPSLLYIRFAHEMNLPQKWSVHVGEEADFVKAITVYSTLRYEIIPAAKVVLCPNDGTSPELGDLDIRTLWPGRDDRGRLVANVYAVDSYNMSPHVTTAAEFTKKINAVDPNGGPLGLEAHRKFAQQVGVPFAVGEWSNNGDPADPLGGGESPVYVQQFYAWAKAHAGVLGTPTPGQLLYEVQFNLWNQYAFWPATIQPRTAAAYKALPWGR